MSRLQDLPVDQRATLALILEQRQSYAGVAALLGIGEQAVHDRAHAALAMLAPRQARELSAEERALLGDYLLGQAAGGEANSATRAFLEASPPARAWASALASELAPLARGGLPDVPADAGAPAARAAADSPAAATSAPQASRIATAPRAASRPSPPLPSSRLGGALLLGGLVAVVVVVVILLSSGGGGSPSSRSTAGAGRGSGGAHGATGSTATASSGRTKEDKRIELVPTEPGSKAIGVAEVLSEGNTYAFYLAAEHLPASKGFFYGVWLYNSPTSAEPLSASPPVGSNGHLQGGALLPSNARDYRTLILTRETSTRPSHPGPIVLSGAFALH